MEVERSPAELAGSAQPLCGIITTVHSSSGGGSNSGVLRNSCPQCPPLFASSCSAQLQERQREMVRLRLQAQGDRLALHQQQQQALQPSHLLGLLHPSHGRALSGLREPLGPLGQGASAAPRPQSVSSTGVTAAAAQASSQAPPVGPSFTSGRCWHSSPRGAASPASPYGRSISRLLLEGSKEAEEERDQREAMLAYLHNLTEAKGRGRRSGSAYDHDLHHSSSGSPATVQPGSATSHRSILGADDDLGELLPKQAHRQRVWRRRGALANTGTEPLTGHGVGCAAASHCADADAGVSAPLPLLGGGSVDSAGVGSRQALPTIASERSLSFSAGKALPPGLR